MPASEAVQAPFAAASSIAASPAGVISPCMTESVIVPVYNTAESDCGGCPHDDAGPALAQVALADRLEWETVEPQPDGGVIVGLAVPALEWAASTALASGPIVEVLEPAELRQRVSERAEAIARRYRR
jgi:hypothetical protein